MQIKLVKPSIKYKKSFLSSFGSLYLFNYQDLNFTKKQIVSDFKLLLKALQNQSDKRTLPKKRVPSTTFWLVKGNSYLGTANIRHYLNKKLKIVGGHIGYEIKESERGKGYGNLILKLALKKAKKLGIKKALLTCDKSNIASKKIIENNGGKFLKASKGVLGNKLRYWIEI